MRALVLLAIPMLLLAACLPGGDDAPPTSTATATPAATLAESPTAVEPTGTPAPSATPTVTNASPLDGTSWRLVELLGEPVDPGCNSFWGEFSLSGRDGIEMGALVEIDAGCASPLFEMNFEERYIDALNVSVRYVLGGNWQLALQGSNGDTLLLFNPMESASASPAPGQQVAGPTPTTPVGDYGNWEIYVMNADGSDQRRPAPSLAGESWPAWMPDGRLSFFSNRTGEQRIFAVWPDSSGLEELPIDPAGFTSGIEWSADGSRIYYASTNDSLEQLYMADADGSNPRRITEIADGTSLPDWTPDGSRVVFANHAHGPPQLYVVNADGSSLQRITFEQEAAFEAPAWSPDGTQIAVGRYPNSELGGIYIMNADGSDSRQLTASEFGDHSPAWSPDGSKIAFVRNSDIWVINVDGTGLTRLTDSPHSDWDPVWSPDGSQIAFVSDRDGGQPVECSFFATNDYMLIESLDQLAWMADTIVTGEVVKQLPSAFGTVQDDGVSGSTYPIYTDYLVEVDAWARGFPSLTIRLRQDGGTVGACTQTFDSEPTIAVGDRLLLFLRTDGFNTDLPPAGFPVGGPQGFFALDADGAITGQGYSLNPGTPAAEIIEMVRAILRGPQPDYSDLVPLEESPVVE